MSTVEVALLCVVKSCLVDLPFVETSSLTCKQKKRPITSPADRPAVLPGCRSSVIPPTQAALLPTEHLRDCAFGIAFTTHFFSTQHSTIQKLSLKNALVRLSAVLAPKQSDDHTYTVGPCLLLFCFSIKSIFYRSKDGGDFVFHKPI